jgi:hypothetical protein
MTEQYGVPVPGLPTIPLTVVIPTHPARGAALDPGTLLGQAVASVRAQTVQPAGGISISCDMDGRGAGPTRQEALDAVETPWCSFLDSDDLMYPHHLARHWELLQEADADVAYSFFDGNNPFPGHRGLVFDPKAPHHITATISVRTSLAKAAGFLQPEGWLHPEWSGEDWSFVLRLCGLGAKFVGTGDITWHYRISHGLNTSGLPYRGDGPLA